MRLVPKNPAAAVESANDWAHFFVDMAKGQKILHHPSTLINLCSENIDDNKNMTSTEENLYANQIDDLKMAAAAQSDDGSSESEGYYILPNITKGKTIKTKGKYKNTIVLKFIVENWPLNINLYYIFIWIPCEMLDIFPTFKIDTIVVFRCCFMTTTES